MRASAVILSGLISLSSAQSTVTLLLPMFESDSPIQASIVASDSAKTTYVVQCEATASTADGCNGGSPITITQGPNTVAFAYTVLNDFSESIDCSIEGTTTATCIVTISESDQTTSTVSTTSGTLNASDLSGVFIPVRVTAGVSSPTSATAPAGVTATPTATGSGSSSSGTGLSSTGTGASAASTKTSTAGMPMITGQAGWVAGGVAVVLAVGAM